MYFQFEAKQRPNELVPMSKMDWTYAIGGLLMLVTMMVIGFIIVVGLGWLLALFIWYMAS